MGTAQAQPPHVEISILDSGIFIFVLAAAMLGYFFLQPWVLRRLNGGWRMAAMIPLAATIPLGLHAVIAYVAGSNLWPLLLIFGLPVATLYLMALLGLHALMHRD